MRWLEVGWPVEEFKVGRVVTGVELRFRSEDESVVISNGDKGGAGLRVHTETRVKRER